MKSIVGLFRIFVIVTGFWIVMYVFAIWIDPAFHGLDLKYSTEATIFTLALLVHEGGHMSTLRLMGIRSTLIPGILIGIATRTDPRDRAKTKKLSLANEFFIHASGMLANACFAIVALGLMVRHMLGVGVTIFIVVTNAEFIFANLLPVPMSDGVKTYLAACGKSSIIMPKG